MLKMNEKFTDEHLEFVRRVANEYEEEFKEWSRNNREYLLQWYDTASYPHTYQTVGQFAYYCTKEFMKYKEGKTEED